MCLAIPGKVVRLHDADPLLIVADVEFGGVTRPCHMACVPEVRLGDYVLVHAGVAITIVDEHEAARVLAELSSIPDDDGWLQAFDTETIS